ncbi:tripartite tricarboxylate transporter permease [Lignipirellula cremea]|uniref:Tripartite tricarboxylate transporter TctA family protein n=1 Tax=Lignipirellula cremea TaxID=2528010 RepID=A0A518E2S0_9BACT|nr:tripartite tricarboxylate transporter permease [Lignipirellula cremea]QDU98363.1 Tripartite tricarboxylate transporter TctA family protein [Lignipirellula cremea]
MGDLSSAFIYLVQPWPLFLVCLGTALGIIVGAIPGLTGAMLIALALPMTFAMSGVDAMVLLVSMYVGSISGGLISATILRMPGTPASMMTTFDGYPLARSGQPGRALGLGISASFIGGLVSWIFLVTLSRPMADLSTRLGPFEYFSLVLVALVLITAVSDGSLMRGLLSGCLGLLAAMPGASPATGQLRWTFGLSELNDGLKLLPVLIGLFAVSQVIHDIVYLDQQAQRIKVVSKGMFLRLADWKAQAVNLIRSSLIGTWVGILPGIGANIGSVMAYSAAKNMSKTPEKFGHGSEEGIVASEAANNATVGGALIPLIAMGIPGSVIDAILLGALVIHGLTPGPLLFEHNPEVIYTMMAAVFLANGFMFLFMVFSAGWLSRLADVPRWLLLPAVLVFCVVGSYALANRMFDVGVMLAFGVIGFALERMKIPLAPFVIGFVLAPLAEANLGAGLMASGGSFWPLATRPLSLMLCLLSLLLLLWPIFQRARQKWMPRTA